MKELTIEQKAQRYDEALERAKEFVCKGNVEVAEYIFPELKESEDEIRKEMIFYFQEEIPQCSIQEHADKMKEFIAWLEKQSEQKRVVIIPKFRIGDEIKTSNEEPLTITKIDEKGYWSEDLFICGFDDAIKWELVEQKPAWSKEDEQHIDSLLKRLDGLCRNEFERTRFAINEDKYWLKSLKDRYTWKPSDEQMKALKGVQEGIFRLGILESLYNDLQKLKGE